MGEKGVSADDESGEIVVAVVIDGDAGEGFIFDESGKIG